MKEVILCNGGRLELIMPEYYEGLLCILNIPYSVKMTSGIYAAMATIVPYIYCLPYRKVCFQVLSESDVRCTQFILALMRELRWKLEPIVPA